LTKSLDIPFRITPGGSFAVTSDYRRVVRNQLVDALMTNFGERLMQPKHGVDVQSRLFQLSDELKRADTAGVIARRIEALVDKVVVIGVEIELTPQKDGPVWIKVSYKPSEYDEVETLAVPFNDDSTQDLSKVITRV
jgi:phage baseplate assembly protein W